MSQRKTLYHWFRTVAKEMDHLSLPQARGLAAFSFGLARSQRCSLAAVSRSLGILGKPDTVERRFQRFLANPRLELAPGCRNLSRWAIEALPAREPLLLLVDETSLQDRLKAMVVSLAYRGKALPLAWRCYHQERWPQGQVELILTLLDWVAGGIPAGRKVTVMVDRGIGSSPRLLRAIAERGWHYLARVPKSVLIQGPEGGTRPIGSLIQLEGERWEGEVRAFKRAGWIQCRALGEWGRGHREPWLILTNDPRATVKKYGQRWWEELTFKDCKSNGWNWQRSRVWDPERANRLWLVMALAWVWMVCLGARVQDRPELRRELTRGRENRHSLFQLGLRCFQRWESLGRRPPCRLRLPPIPKTVVQ